ncbi:MAG TPA: tetratricopeptide repeat protein [Gammaproteobacteria bacterium]|jgi:tetratricopeptide (TPR) repeat protein|nr:tetratricopeptide repeat protein [Gammaproteobacteria bacterium]
MIRDLRHLSDSCKPVLLGLLALGFIITGQAAWADHLPPGIQVIYVNPSGPVAGRSPGLKSYTDADIDQASELAKLGDAEAEANLGVMLATRGKYQEAAVWYQKAAEAGLSAAAYNLGTLYYNGQGFQQDYAKALHWFQAAAKRNDPYAEFQLGMMYDLGHGVDASPEQEMSWYTKAARQGLAAAQYNLAVIYHNAEGVTQDDVTAYAWLLLAERGGVDVSEAKPVVTDGMTPEQMRSAETLSRSLYVAADNSLRE